MDERNFMEHDTHEDASSNFTTPFTTPSYPSTTSLAPSLDHKLLIIFSVLGGLFVFAILLYITRYCMYRRGLCQSNRSELLYSQVEDDAESFCDDDGDDESLDNLYTSCRLYVEEDTHVNANVEDFEYDTVSVTERGTFVNEEVGATPNLVPQQDCRQVNEFSDGLQNSRLLLGHHFRKKS